MDTTVLILAIVTNLWSYVESVPPEACFANFRWDDCGSPPQAVLYYYKPGSRCEVGFWRGCLPNSNMFKDEYECVNTCIFTVRAEPEDYHHIVDVIDDHEILDKSDEVTESSTTLTENTTERDGNVTETTNSTKHDGGVTEPANSTKHDGEVTESANNTKIPEPITGSANNDSVPKAE